MKFVCLLVIIGNLITICFITERLVLILWNCAFQKTNFSFCTNIVTDNCILNDHIEGLLKSAENPSIDPIYAKKKKTIKSNPQLYHFRRVVIIHKLLDRDCFGDCSASAGEMGHGYRAVVVVVVVKARIRKRKINSFRYMEKLEGTIVNLFNNYILYNLFIITKQRLRS